MMPRMRQQRHWHCVHCGKEFVAYRSDTQWCSDACKMKAFRARKAKRAALLIKRALRRHRLQAKHSKAAGGSQR